VHSVAVAQVTPFGFLPQMVPLQTNPVAQSALVAQLVLHALVPQTYGLHALRAPAAHIPVPLHLPASISAPFMHIVMPQVVPDA
jgi:hypothetical protein